MKLCTQLLIQEKVFDHKITFFVFCHVKQKSGILFYSLHCKIKLILINSFLHYVKKFWAFLFFCPEKDKILIPIQLSQKFPSLKMTLNQIYAEQSFSDSPSSMCHIHLLADSLNDT